METNNDLWKALAAPFPAEDIEWRVQQSGVKNSKGWAMVLAYVTNRAIQQRLDDVFSPAGWKNEYSKAPDDGVLCGISIRVSRGNSDRVTVSVDGEPVEYAEAYEWVTKYDGAENTALEAVKGGLSGAMKRAAVQWGIGRYLYQLESTFVEVSTSKTNEATNYVNIKDKDHKSLMTGYWGAPKLPAWALPKLAAEKLAPPDIPPGDAKDAEPPTSAKPGLIKPESMKTLKAKLAASGQTGVKATEFVQFLLGKDKPESESEVQELLAALETGREVDDYLAEDQADKWSSGTQA